MPRILIAEDDASMLHFLGGALERAGHAVTLCADGVEALAAFEAARKDGPAPFDLLLADIVMPGMDGIELSQRATALSPALKVMFITGFAGVALGQEEENRKVMSKPFHLNDLIDQVNRLLNAPAPAQNT